jgi:hypothetical protein
LWSRRFRLLDSSQIRQFPFAPQISTLPAANPPSRTPLAPQSRTKALDGRLRQKKDPNGSTGPTSPDGKARSSQNSLKHGLCSQELILTNEDPGNARIQRSPAASLRTPAGFHLTDSTDAF